MSVLKKGLAVLFVFLLVSCGRSTIEGEYVGADGMFGFDFKPDGTVVQSMMGNKIAQFKYEKEGNVIKIYTSENVAQIFTLDKNENLLGPGGIELSRKKK